MHTGYLSLQQRAWLKAHARSWLWRSELPTWLLIGVIYGGWFSVMLNAQMLGRLPATLLLIVFTGWYMSLQHELIHGHPTRWPRMNQLFGTLPLAVWYPYGLYRDSHLAHHRNHTLTEPDEDPETYYLSPARWAKLRRWQQQLIHLRNTFLGRLLLGPLLDVAATFGGIWQALRRGDRSAIAMWLLHGTLLALLFFWMARQGFSPLWYLLMVSYPALALTKVRSFYEHRAADDPLARSVNNEAAWPWRMLFLNLNYHSVHHDLPGVPWYGLRRLYLRDRDHYYQRNHGFRVAGYRVWLRQFWVRPVGVNVHPGRSAEKTHE
ncbi:fatty acid desaturase [Pantoea agglomerans]|uniref:fatty acid desaturase n=1 Tax=Enterobacter agglomerans TaxID=549 RepID=UPI0013B5AFCB|nr:fatty acid desaturase [Pantoea agglomerans]NEG57696.1 fatty acid desaturase [Pantoea agglomerans]NEG97280.1 fatty acid desaturase [Pantoea agglomerans]NEH04628.1 fatty acid desaturase [Pantoea agglomerans]NEH13970.1 fatty acid desaturase [Pantoea agglomerans]